MEDQEEDRWKTGHGGVPGKSEDIAQTPFTSPRSVLNYPLHPPFSFFFSDIAFHKYCFGVPIPLANELVRRFSVVVVNITLVLNIMNLQRAV